MTIGAIACFSQIVITRSCRLTEKYTYKEMGQVVVLCLSEVQNIFGNTGGVIVSLIMLLYTCGSCISYFVIIGDLFLDAFSFLLPSLSFLQNRAIVVGSICLFLIFPLCMLRSALSVLSLTPSGRFAEVRLRCLHPLHPRHRRRDHRRLRLPSHRQPHRRALAPLLEDPQRGPHDVRLLQLPLQRPSLLLRRSLASLSRPGAQKPVAGPHVADLHRRLVDHPLRLPRCVA